MNKIFLSYIFKLFPAIIIIIFLTLMLYKLETIPSPHFDESEAINHFRYGTSQEYREYPLLQIWKIIDKLWLEVLCSFFKNINVLFFHRLLNVVFFAATLISSYILLKKIIGGNNSLIVILFLIISPVLFVNVRIHTSYHYLNLFFNITGLLCVCYGYSSKKIMSIIMGNILIAISCLIHIMYLIFFISILAIEIFMLLRKQKIHSIFNKKIKFISVIISIISIIILLFALANYNKFFIFNINNFNFSKLNNAVENFFFIIDRFALYISLMTGEYAFKAFSGIWIENIIIKRIIIIIFLFIIIYPLYKSRKKNIVKASLFLIAFNLLAFEICYKLSYNTLFLKLFYNVKYLPTINFIAVLILMFTILQFEIKKKILILSFLFCFYSFSIYKFYFFEFQYSGGVYKRDKKVIGINYFCNLSETGRGEIFYQINPKQNLFEEISNYLHTEIKEKNFYIFSPIDLAHTLRMYMPEFKNNIIELYRPSSVDFFNKKVTDKFYFISYYYCYEDNDENFEIIRYFNKTPLDKFNNYFNNKNIVLTEKKYLYKAKDCPLIVIYRFEKEFKLLKNKNEGV